MDYEEKSKLQSKRRYERFINKPENRARKNAQQRMITIKKKKDQGSNGIYFRYHRGGVCDNNKKKTA